MNPRPTTVVFVAPFLLETSLRFLQCVGELRPVGLILISQDGPEKLPPEVKRVVDAHIRIADGLDPTLISGAVEDVIRNVGPVDRLVAALEQLQVPLAAVRERHDIPGMDVETARNFRDKARMKSVLWESGVPCARHRLVGRAEEAQAFVREAGFPVVVKPPAGAGGKGTFRLDDPKSLAQYLGTFPLSREHPTLFEEFVTGEEYSFDCICIQGRAVWHSVSRYYPTPLEVMEKPWIQWCVLLPRRIDGPEYAGIRAAGVQALEALGMGTGLSHMEWFRRPDGSVAISEVGARPPGAQFTTLISYAHDLDFYRAWAELMVFDRFDPPARTHAAGAVFLRGQGQGRVTRIRGLEQAQREIGPVVMETRLPRRGQMPSGSYEGEGYVIVRHPETSVVENALERLLELIRVDLG